VEIKISPSLYLYMCLSLKACAKLLEIGIRDIPL